jgi:hypothetical protein
MRTDPDELFRDADRVPAEIRSLVGLEALRHLLVGGNECYPELLTLRHHFSRNRVRIPDHPTAIWSRARFAEYSNAHRLLPWVMADPIADPVQTDSIERSGPCLRTRIVESRIHGSVEAEAEGAWVCNVSKLEIRGKAYWYNFPSVNVILSDETELTEYFKEAGEFRLSAVACASRLFQVESAVPPRAAPPARILTSMYSIKDAILPQEDDRKVAQVTDRTVHGATRPFALERGRQLVLLSSPVLSPAHRQETRGASCFPARR